MSVFTPPNICISRESASRARMHLGDEHGAVERTRRAELRDAAVFVDVKENLVEALCPPSKQPRSLLRTLARMSDEDRCRP
jgi:hypothetical protein